MEVAFYQGSVTVSRRTAMLEERDPQAQQSIRLDVKGHMCVQTATYGVHNGAKRSGAGKQTIHRRYSCDGDFQGS